ncbi:hypothetical protein DL768_000204 [Monosporascus sp. mg162]|nr:hypothetical protein DL768_000204 [Monosporascus sp. mg162]
MTYLTRIGCNNRKIITIIITITTSTRTITTYTITSNMPFRAQRAVAARARAVRAEQLAAERAAEAAAAAELEPEPERQSTPAPVPPAPPAPNTPARPPRQRPARGARRAEPCYGCLRSALAGRSTGECFDAAVGSRCWRYASGYTCTPVLANARPTAVRFVKALQNDALRREVDRFRAAVRMPLEGEGGKKEQGKQQQQ